MIKIILGIWLLLQTITIGQIFEFKTIVIDQDTVTQSVKILNLPHTEKQLEHFLDVLYDNLRFKTDDDGLKFALYISIICKVLRVGSTWEEAAEIFVENTNWWLKDQYYEYWNL